MYHSAILYSEFYSPGCCKLGLREYFLFVRGDDNLYRYTSRISVFDHASLFICIDSEKQLELEAVSSYPERYVVAIKISRSFGIHD